VADQVSLIKSSERIADVVNSRTKKNREREDRLMMDILSAREKSQRFGVLLSKTNANKQQLFGRLLYKFLFEA